MDHFIDIRIKPDDEMRENVLLNKVYTKFHKALCILESTDIGVSFPQFEVLLGRTFRVHGSLARLRELQDLQWLGGLLGYCDVDDILPVKGILKYRTVSRKQPAMTLAKLRRLANRGSITPEKAKEYKAKMFSKGLDNPYLELESISNGHLHRRYLEFGALRDSDASGEFDQFGLSRTATIPWF
jgi:CRISPR-associated endonuclease Csy4